MLVSAAIAPVQAASLTQWNFDPLVGELHLTVKDGTTPRYFLMANPARIVIDLPDTAVGEISPQGSYTGAVRQIRVSQFQPGLTRIVMELAPDVALAPGQVKLQKVDAARWTLRPLLAQTAASSSAKPSIASSRPTTTSVPLPAVRANLPVASPPAVSGETSILSSPTAATASSPNGGDGFMVDTAGSVTISVPPPEPLPVSLDTVSPSSNPPPPRTTPSLSAALPPSTKAAVPVGQVSVPPLQSPATQTPLAPAVKVPHLASTVSPLPPDAAATVPIPPLQSTVASPAVPTVTPLPPAARPGDLQPQSTGVAQPGTHTSVHISGDSLPSSFPTGPTNPSSTPKITVPPLAPIAPVTIPAIAPPQPVVSTMATQPPAFVRKTQTGDRPTVNVNADSLPSVLESPASTPTVTVPSLENEPVPVRTSPVAVPPLEPIASPQAINQAATTPAIVSVPPLQATPPSSVIVPLPSSPDMPGQLPSVPVPQRVVDFGQPLPATSVTAVPRSAQPGFPGNPTVAYRPLPPNVLLPTGTTLNLRYPGETALKLDTSSKQEVLLLQTDIRDAIGQVTVPQGSMVIGRFETTTAGTRFIAQAISLGAQTLPLSAQSDRLDGDRQISDTTLVRNTGIGVLAGGLIGGLAGANPGWSALGGAAAGAATSLLTAPKPATIQPGQVVPVRLTQDLQRL